MQQISTALRMAKTLYINKLFRVLAILSAIGLNQGVLTIQSAIGLKHGVLTILSAIGLNHEFWHF